MKDAVDYLMETQFGFANRQQMSVTFDEPSSGRVLYELAHLPGVQRCEPLRAIPIRLRFGPRERRVSILGLMPDSELFRVIDRHRRVVPIPSEGLVLSAKLAELFDAYVGDRMTVEVLEGDRPVREVPVVALVDDLAGTDAYMDIDAVHRLMRESDVASGAFLATDMERIDELYTALKNTPHVAGVSVTQSALASFRKTIAENLLRMRLFNVLFASVIAFGVVYNSARIALSERSRELATLRVLGYTL
jgi:putative ABC transport system permease protein